MSTSDDYLSVVRARMVADGCVISDEVLGSRSVLLGYKAQVRALSRVHIFIAVVEAGRVDDIGVRNFVQDVVGLAANRKGRWRGAQSGIIVIPVMVAGVVNANAIATVCRPYRLNVGGFALLAQPVVVDMSEATMWTFRGRRIWGYAFNSLIREKISAYLPEPVRGE